MASRSQCTPFARWGRERGATYLLLMLAIVLIGISSSVGAKQWKTMVQRELEADLLARGIEIQTALMTYSAAMKKGRVVPGEIYPLTLEELIKQPKPFLRKVYKDPMTGGDWDIMRDPTGRIMGVRSRSKAAPIKQHNFPLVVRQFEGMTSYNEWIFRAQPLTAAGVPGIGQTPGSAPGAPAGTNPAQPPSTTLPGATGTPSVPPIAPGSPVPAPPPGGMGAPPP
jgi:type II secretory pathway pseudopilin PulG